MKGLIALALAAGISTSVFGQSTYTFSSLNKENPTGLVARGQNPVKVLHKEDGRFATNNVRKIRQAAQARVVKANEDIQNQYGTVVVKMFEDFSKMSTGTFDEPDYDTYINDYTMNEIAWWNILPEFTELPNWGSHYAYPAGGCLFLDADNQEGAQLNTPLIDVSDHCRIAVIRFKARTKTGTASRLLVEATETYDMSPSGWDIFPGTEINDITSEWKTYEVMFKGTGASTMFNFVQYPTDQIYIDDITVYQIDQYIDTPVTLPHTNYTNEGFTANWEAVEGADYYFLNVYQIDMMTGTVIDLLVDQKVEGTSYDVTNIVSGETYYYTLRAVKGNRESIETLPVEVFDLAAPVLNKPSEIVNDRYTASWDAVASAERYNYIAYFTRKAEADGEFAVTNENFDGITDPDGTLTGFTIDNPTEETYPELYLNNINQAGWRGQWFRAFTDYVCVDGWQYIFGQGDAGLVSPELDLSKDNGKVNISLKLYGETGDFYDQHGELITAQTQCAVALFNYNETLGDFKQEELIYIEGVKPEWNNFNVTLTKGSERSKVGIYAVRAPARLYIDDLKITQNYKQGDQLLDPFFFARWYENTSIDVEIPAKVVESSVYHKVNAVKARSGNDPYGGAEYTESKYSSTELVAENVTSTGIEGTTINEAAGAYVNNGTLFITNPAKANVAVYAVDGTQVYSDKSGKQNYAVSLGGHGIYVVKIGDNAIKVRN